MAEKRQRLSLLLGGISIDVKQQLIPLAVTAFTRGPHEALYVTILHCFVPPKIKIHSCQTWKLGHGRDKSVIPSHKMSLDNQVSLNPIWLQHFIAWICRPSARESPEYTNGHPGELRRKRSKIEIGSTSLFPILRTECSQSYDTIESPHKEVCSETANGKNVLTCQATGAKERRIGGNVAVRIHRDVHCISSSISPYHVAQFRRQRQQRTSVTHFTIVLHTKGAL